MAQYLDFKGLQAYDVAIKEFITAAASTTELDQAVENLQLLVGDTSVESQITAAIAALINDAPSNLDTLKEIADWINTHGEAAAALIESVATLGEKVEAVDAKIEAFQPISSASIEALFLAAKYVQPNQTVQTAINNLAKDEKLVLTTDVDEDVTFIKNAVVEAEGVTFNGKVIVVEGADVTVIGATFAGEVVVETPEEL